MSRDVLARLEAIVTHATCDGHHRVPVDLLVGAVLAIRSAREQTALHVGRCGDQAQAPFGRIELCELPAGHAGWHRAGIAEWIATAPPPMCPDCRVAHP